MLGETTFISVSGIFMQKDRCHEFRCQETQLITSLKFHFGKTLPKVPLDVALNAMLNVWESCQDDEDDDETLVCSREVLNQSLLN